MCPTKPLFESLSHRSSQQAGNFAFLQTQVAQWQKLTSLVRPYLPKDGQWQVVRYQQGILTISGKNQALISQLRYLNSQYIEQLKTLPSLMGLHKIHVIMHIPTKTMNKTYTRNVPLSNETKQELQQAALYVNNPKLSQALLRLASAVCHKDE